MPWNASGTWTGSPAVTHITDEVTGAHSGQVDGELGAHGPKRVDGSSILGVLSYTIFDDEAHVRMLQVIPSAQRKGVATALVQALRDLGYPVRPGYATDEGDAFWKASQKESFAGLLEMAPTRGSNFWLNKYEIYDSRLTEAGGGYLSQLVKTFGRTDNPHLGGWILPEGDFLDLSAGSGSRADRHRTINQVLRGTSDRFDSRYAAMMHIAKQNQMIRWSPEAWSAELVTKPTPAQRKTLEYLAHMSTRYGRLTVEGPGGFERYYQADEADLVSDNLRRQFGESLCTEFGGLIEEVVAHNPGATTPVGFGVRLRENFPSGWSMEVNHVQPGNGAEEEDTFFDIFGPDVNWQGADVTRRKYRLVASASHREKTVGLQLLYVSATQGITFQAPNAGLPGVAVLAAVRSELKVMFPGYRILAKRITGNNPRSISVKLGENKGVGFARLITEGAEEAWGTESAWINTKTGHVVAVDSSHDVYLDSLGVHGVYRDRVSKILGTRENWNRVFLAGWLRYSEITSDGLLFNGQKTRAAQDTIVEVCAAALRFDPNLHAKAVYIDWELPRSREIFTVGEIVHGL